ACATLYARGDRPPEQVAAAFQRAVTLAPRDPVAHQEYARWLLKSAKTTADRDRAAKLARQAISLGVTDPASYLILGRALPYNGDRVGAVEPLLHAAQMAPEDPAPALALAQAYRALRQAEAAKTWQASYLQRQRLTWERSRLFQEVSVAPD